MSYASNEFDLVSYIDFELRKNVLFTISLTDNDLLNVQFTYSTDR